jgi:hypothetical protein
MTDMENEKTPTPAPASGPEAPEAPGPAKPAGATGAEPVGVPVPAEKIARRRALLAVAMGLGLVAIVAFAVLGYQSFTARLAAAEKLDRATAMVEDADTIVVRTDAVVRAKMTPDLAEDAREAAGDIDEAAKLLSDAIALMGEAYPDLNDDDRERATLLKDSAEARQEMLVHAPVILEANVSASKALPLAQQGWESLVEADRLSDKAVAAYNKLTKAGVNESQKLNKQAAVVLATAEERFVAAEDAFPAAPFEVYIAYAQTRIKLNRLSQQSDTAWLKGDITKANSVIAEYNREDQKAVKQAKELPSTPEAAIADAFEKAVTNVTDAYYAARDHALAADERLRAY